MTQFQIECVESKVESSCNQYGRFIVEPLELGQGITIGNALRRVLLSDIEGSAITAVRIAGVNHEFCSIPGVKEDVLELLLNLKNIVLKSYTNEPQIGRVKIQGSSKVTTANFELPSEVEIIHGTQYVATVAENAILEMEFKIEKGRGYKIVDKKNPELNSIDFLPIDAIFMPVRKVNYMVEEIFLRNSEIKERLILEIWTNGSVTPQDSISQAAEVLLNLFNPFKKINFENTEDSTEPTEDKISQIPIEELQLSVRAYNCLKRAQIHSIGDLLNVSQEELLEIRNFGQKSAKEVIDALQKRLGISLPKRKTNKKEN
uniref:DNA-directed RNA polymerase subunit alpha n=1 Tax=Cyanophora biloba TaxID=1489483 RepID=A0A2Z4HGB6_9EUKA|nr:RNA polymerase alpha subunit [Cyanophora biloba]AWW13788.1 RNA polymerase alpha subunit [Cyanophora biloba]